jgi:hypothetical protein
MAQGKMDTNITYNKATKKQESIFQLLDYRLFNAWYGRHGPRRLLSL